jgi:methionyl-tRNA formyltransferase
MAQPLRVALVAEEAAGARTFKLVVDSGHELVLVVTTADATSPTAGAARAADAVFEEPGIVREAAFAERLRDARVDLLLNVHSLLIVRPDALGIPSVGSFNLHPGPLPEWAGLDAPSWAIAAGASTYGCTVHWMNAGIDAGPIAYATTFPVSDRETGLSLNARCARQGLVLLARLLEAAGSGASAIPATPQAAAGRRYFRRGPPGDGVVDWDTSGESIDRFVRACDFHPLPSPWAPAPRTWVGGRELRILKTLPTSEPARADPGTVARVAGGAAFVAAGDTLVQISSVAVKGQPTPADAVLQPGMVLETQPSR